jgi:hypothetical protein
MPSSQRKIARPRILNAFAGTEFLDVKLDIVPHERPPLAEFYQWPFVPNETVANRNYEPRLFLTLLMT